MPPDGNYFLDPAVPWSIIGIAVALFLWWGAKDVPTDDWDIPPRIGLSCIALYWMNRIAHAIDPRDSAITIWTPRILAVALIFILGLAKWSRRS
jgi:hypothetical protein